MSDQVSGRLLVSGFPQTDDAPWLLELRDVLDGLGLRFRLTRSSRRRIRRLRSTRGPASELLDSIWVSTVVIEPAKPGSRRPPQAWWVLERLRQVRPALADRVALVEVRRRATMGPAPLLVDGVGVPA